MIVDWLQQAPVLLMALAIVFVPGLVAFSAVGLRGLALFAAAPLFGIASTALIAVGLGALGIGWSVISWLVATAVLVGLAFVIARLLRGWRAEASSGSPRWLLAVAVLIGVVLGGWRLITYISDPSGISQTNDAVFHMNAIRFIVETGDASSLHVNAVIGGHSFYPAAWHGVVSLVVLTTGTGIPIAANIFTVVIGALIWVFGVAWLTREVTGSTVMAGYAAVLSGALQTFPLLMFQWGVLFPNALSTALIPAAVAAVVSSRRISTDTPMWRSVVRTGIFVLIAAAALAFAQPASLLPWAAICVVWLTFRLVPAAVRGDWLRAGGAILVSWVALAALWLYLAQSTSGSHWPPFRSKLQAGLDVLLNGQVLIPYAWGVSLLALVGLIVAVRTPRYRWWTVAWAGVSGLYVLVASFGSVVVRNDLLGAWYADPYRIAGLAPLTAIPLAAIGLDALTRALARRATSIDATTAGVVGTAAATVFMVVLVPLRPVPMPAFLEGTYDRESRYIAAEDSFLDPDERLLLEKLADVVPADARVIANPSTGSGFGYFLSGVDVYPRTWAQPRHDDWQLLTEHLRDAADDARVCEALETYGQPEYVLDFGLGEEGPGRYEMRGMTDFADRDGFELVLEQGDASLWRITACAQ